MSLTRQQLGELCKPRFEWREIPGIGKVGVRSWQPSSLSRRQGQILNDDGTLVDNHAHLMQTYQIIDQLMESESDPVFTDDDVELINGFDGIKRMAILQMLDAFNGDEAKNQ